MLLKTVTIEPAHKPEIPVPSKMPAAGKPPVPDPGTEQWQHRDNPHPEIVQWEFGVWHRPRVVHGGAQLAVHCCCGQGDGGAGPVGGYACLLSDAG